LSAPALVLLAWAAVSGQRELKEQMIARGIPADKVVVAFAATPNITTFAAEAVQSTEDPSVRANRIYEAIVALKKRGAIEADRDNSPKSRSPKTAADLLSTAQRAGITDRKAGCYELSALYVAAARSVGLDAVGVERSDFSGVGQIGHIMAAVHLANSAALLVLDLQNESKQPRWPIRELTDLEFAAHHYNHLAVSHYLRGELDKTEQAIRWALMLAPENVSFNNNMAAVLNRLGEPALAASYSAEAVVAAPEVALFRYQLARSLLSSGDTAGAIVQFQAALHFQPSYGVALRDLAWALLDSGEREKAGESLRQLYDHNPSTPEITTYLTLFYLAQDDTFSATKILREARERKVTDPALAALRVLAGLEPGRPELSDEVEHLRRALAGVRQASKAHTVLPEP
jgi:Flp pilus assembly protein TadD